MSISRALFIFLFLAMFHFPETGASQPKIAFTAKLYTVGSSTLQKNLQWGITSVPLGDTSYFQLFQRTVPLTSILEKNKAELVASRTLLLSPRETGPMELVIQGSQGPPVRIEGAGELPPSSHPFGWPLESRATRPRVSGPSPLPVIGKAPASPQDIRLDLHVTAYPLPDGRFRASLRLKEKSFSVTLKGKSVAVGAIRTHGEEKQLVLLVLEIEKR